MTADEALFRAHLQEPTFLSGMSRGRWGLPPEQAEAAWPNCLLWIEADPRIAPGKKILLRFTVDGYPATAPGAIPWTLEGEKSYPTPANDWPKGCGHTAAVFKPGWNSTGLYCPCDRAAMPGHDAWKTQLGLRDWWWTSDKTITLYLEFVHRCLNPNPS